MTGMLIILELEAEQQHGTEQDRSAAKYKFGQYHCNHRQFADYGFKGDRAWGKKSTSSSSLLNNIQTRDLQKAHKHRDNKMATKKLLEPMNKDTRQWKIYVKTPRSFRCLSE